MTTTKVIKEIFIIIIIIKFLFNKKCAVIFYVMQSDETFNASNLDVKRCFPMHSAELEGSLNYRKQSFYKKVQSKCRKLGICKRF